MRMKTQTRLLTLDDLLFFCQQFGLASFSASNYGYSLAVQVPGDMAFEEDNRDGDLLYAHLKVCHTLLNRNGSFIAEEDMKRAMPTLKYKPILASIIENDDGDLDFNSHDMRLVENDDGEREIEYIERQVGNFTNDDPYLEYDADMDKTYVHAIGVIPREYTKTAEIIERKGGTKVSCEITVNEFTYNANEKRLEITDFFFTGVTLLGEHVGEGMLGSRLDIQDFSAEKNSVFSHGVKAMEPEMELLINNSMKGGSEVGKLAELLAKYGKTLEDLPFASEIEEMTDEDLEARFAECFDEADTDEADVDDEADADAEAELEQVDEVDEIAEPVADVDFAEAEVDAEFVEEAGAPEEAPRSNSYSVFLNDKAYQFDLSLNDRLAALTELVNSAYGETDNCWYAVTAYDDYVVMVDWWSEIAYKQSYVESDGVFSLTGERVRVYAQYLTQEEIDALESLKKNYAALVKENADRERDAVINDESYAAIRETDEWQDLIRQASSFNAQELAEKADAIYGRFYKKTASMGAIGISIVEPKKNKGPYGNLFDD